MVLPATKAENHALKETESSVRSCSASRSARFALVRAAEAFASVTEDSVLHFAAANPENAARIGDHGQQHRLGDRQQAVAPAGLASSACSASLRCSPISLPTSDADSPSATAHASDGC